MDGSLVFNQLKAFETRFRFNLLALFLEVHAVEKTWKNTQYGAHITTITFSCIENWKITT